MKIPITRIKVYDGWRGLLALWVLLGHICLVTEYYIPIISAPGYAVDVFMLISGYFIQANLCELKLRYHDNKLLMTKFYKKRILRIYPPYIFTLLLFVFIICILWIIGILPDKYKSLLFLDNILVNLTLLNGIFPKYNNSMVIPSWSLSLEIQFYLIAPFIFYYSLIRNNNYLIIIGIICAIFIECNVYEQNNPYYGLPSVLPLRLMVFISGMLIFDYEKNKRIYLVILLIGLLNLKLSILIVIFMMLSKDYKFNYFYKFLLINPMQHLGKISYEIYLVHAPIIFFVCLAIEGNIIQYGSVFGGEYFILVCVITVPLTYIFSFLISKIKL